MGKLRRNLYKAARILGDIEAVSKGKAGKRLKRRVAGKYAGKSLKSAGCFIATAVYGEESKEVQLLRNFRDFHLLKNPYGKVLVKIYYFFSPPVAVILRKYKILRKIVKFQLNLISKKLLINLISKKLLKKKKEKW